MQARWQLWSAVSWFWNVRYFSGHTTGSDGKVQFVYKVTKIDKVLEGFIAIFTIAVSVIYN